MKHLIVLILLFLSARQVYSQELLAALFSKEVVVKTKTAGRICDTYSVDYAYNAEPEFSFVITGARRSPQRFRSLRQSFSSSSGEPALQSAVFFISQRNISLDFLPNFLQKKGKRIQLYRNYGGEDYSKLEFKAEQNGRMIKSWTGLSSLGENRDHAILGEKRVSGKTVLQPWEGSVFAGNFNLNVGDTLQISVRSTETKRLVQSITIFRPEDKATNFIYYKVPVSSAQFGLNLQNILNTSEDIGEEDIQHGNSAEVFHKDYASIGLLRFLGLDGNEVIEYSFGNEPYKWNPVSSQEYEKGIFIVLSNDMEGGKDHPLYLRYKSQPETIHKITIKVKEKPAHIPWKRIAAISILLLITALVAIYLWNKRNKRKLAALRRKNEDTEVRLALLSGQLNPHFLFNSLNAIQGTINSGDASRANTYIGDVAAFMRNVMNKGSKEFVSLQEEVSIEEDYLKLEQERMDFSYAVTIGPDLDPSQIDIPPLLLQPVLENSIRHAFGLQLPAPLISLSIYRENTSLCMELADNGNIPWEPADVQEGYGLSLTKKRMAVYNEKLESMSIKMEMNYLAGTGTVTTFTFQNWLA